MSPRFLMMVPSWEDTGMKSRISNDDSTRQVSHQLLAQRSIHLFFIAKTITRHATNCISLTSPQVSSVTQTTVTERECLSQLLQEKDQLQREQEDRIKNLTKLLVTSSNLVKVKKVASLWNALNVLFVSIGYGIDNLLLPALFYFLLSFIFVQAPKRRVTWGGKLLRSAQSADFHAGVSDASFADPFSSNAKMRKTDMSTLEEQVEGKNMQYPVHPDTGDLFSCNLLSFFCLLIISLCSCVCTVYVLTAAEEFDSCWNIPEDFTLDTEMDQSSVTARSFRERWMWARSSNFNSIFPTACWD